MKAIFDINGFTVNALGFSRGMWLLTASILFALLCFCFVLTVRNGRMKPRAFWIETLWLALAYAALMMLGRLAWAPEGGRVFWRPTQPMLVWLGAAVVIIALSIWYFRRRKKRFADQVSSTAIRRSAAGSGAAKYCYALLFASMLVSSVICGLRICCGDSIIHLVVPMALVVIVMLLNALTGWRFWYLIGSVLLIVYDVLWMQNLLARTDFGYMPVLAMLPLCLATILPLLTLGTQKK